VKIGGGANDFFERERWADTVNDLERWMASDGDDDVADRLHDVLVDLMPTTNFLSLTSKPCVTTCTDDGELQCERLGKNGRVIAVGGCQGKAAGPADAIGRAVASQVMDALREA
jgi:sarcosine oxidase